uniref:Uncharacterized protein n=1 Tax=Meloidogyne enterolobii TaxID=390850 RepID=A0A6V7X6C7_MELEN|nr:unnamed protein product [Meloidogyne enterolobii]
MSITIHFSDIYKLNNLTNYNLYVYPVNLIIYKCFVKTFPNIFFISICCR